MILRPNPVADTGRMETGSAGEVSEVVGKRCHSGLGHPVTSTGAATARRRRRTQRVARCGRGPHDRQCDGRCTGDARRRSAEHRPSGPGTSSRPSPAAGHAVIRTISPQAPGGMAASCRLSVSSGTAIDPCCDSLRSSPARRRSPVGLGFAGWWSVGKQLFETASMAAATASTRTTVRYGLSWGERDRSRRSTHAARFSSRPMARPAGRPRSAAGGPIAVGLAWAGGGRAPGGARGLVGHDKQGLCAGVQAARTGCPGSSVLTRAGPVGHDRVVVRPLQVVGAGLGDRFVSSPCCSGPGSRVTVPPAGRPTADAASVIRRS